MSAAGGVQLLSPARQAQAMAALAGGAAAAAAAAGGGRKRRASDMSPDGAAPPGGGLLPGDAEPTHGDYENGGTWDAAMKGLAKRQRCVPS
jgi:hypothetical protein